MRKTTVLHFWFQEKIFKERRFVYQNEAPPGIGDAVLDAMLRRTKEKLSLPKTISDSLSAAINALAAILQTAGTLIDSSAGLLVSGLDWAKFGFERLVKWSKDPGAPRPYLDEYTELAKYFITFNVDKDRTGAVRLDADKQIINDNPEIKKIIEAQVAVSFFNFKLRQAQKFYEPAQRNFEKAKLRLNLIRESQTSDQMRKLAEVNMEVESLESDLEKGDASDPATERALRDKLLVAKSKQERLSKMLSYDVMWGTAESVSSEFPPKKNPPEYLDRLVIDDARPMKIHLPDLFAQLESPIKAMQPFIKLYANEAEKQAHVRDEQARILGERLAKEGRDKTYTDSVLKIINKDFLAIIKEYDAAYNGIDASFRTEPNVKPTPLMSPVGNQPVTPAPVVPSPRGQGKNLLR